jgi:hypothetical protein
MAFFLVRYCYVIPRHIQSCSDPGRVSANCLRSIIWHPVPASFTGKGAENRIIDGKNPSFRNTFSPQSSPWWSGNPDFWWNLTFSELYPLFQSTELPPLFLHKKTTLKKIPPSPVRSITACKRLWVNVRAAPIRPMKQRPWRDEDVETSGFWQRKSPRNQWENPWLCLEIGYLQFQWIL